MSTCRFTAELWRWEAPAEGEQLRAEFEAPAVVWDLDGDGAAEAIHWRQRHNDMQALSKIALEFAKWERQRIVDELAGVVSQVPISLRLAYPKMKQAKVGQLNVRASRRQSR